MKRMVAILLISAMALPLGGCYWGGPGYGGRRGGGGSWCYWHPARCGR